MGVLEGWSFVDALYFGVSSLMTIGYGDVVPKQQSGRLFAAAWLTYCFVVMGGLIGNIISAQLEFIFQRRKLQIQDQAVSLRRISELDRGNGVNSGDFLASMLVLLQKVTWQDIRPVLKSFADLDSEGKGYLTAEKIDVLRSQTQTQLEFFKTSESQRIQVSVSRDSATEGQ